MTNYQQVIQETIHNMAKEKNVEITEHSNLFELGILDSLNMIMIIAQLENELSIHLNAEELEAENFESIASICKMIEEHIES